MFKDKKIFILGMARSGYEVAKLLVKENCKILITDKVNNESQIKELTDLGITCVITDLQAELLDDSFDYVIKNPGVPIDNPVCLKAEELNIEVINEVEVAYHFLKNVKIIGVTGSNGKTTTTTLIYNILKKSNLNVHLGGNIGIPLSKLVTDIKEHDILVIELSAQQLLNFKDFKVDIAVLTNLVPVHLDFFRDYEFYINCKQRIFKGCSLGIVNELNLDCLTISSGYNNLYFNSLNKSDLYFDDYIYYKNENIISLKDIKVKGVHNYENIMCAIAVAKQFNIQNDVIVESLKEFKGVEHRLEFVDEINGVSFYNDSKSTNVESTITALKSFNTPTILLLGGLDRNHSFDDLLDYMNNVKCVISYGETKNRIFEFCNKNSIPCFKEDNLKKAVDEAIKYSTIGDTILLSPACASWDSYKNFEERGIEFKNIVNGDV